jgi:DNA-binding Lrp family transcriptional regulator
MAKPGPKPRIDAADVLDVFDRRDDRGEPLTAPELADALNCSRRTALNRLTDLADDGRLRSKQVGGRSRVYWVPLAGEGKDIAASSVSGDVAPDPGEEADSPGGTEALDADEALADLALDADRREAVRAMYDYLTEHGTARKSDFTGDVYPEHSAGYASPGGWWNALGKGALASLPGIKKPAEGRPTWQFSGK